MSAARAGAAVVLLPWALLLGCGDDYGQEVRRIDVVDARSERAPPPTISRVVQEMTATAEPGHTVYDPPPDLARPPNAPVWPPPPGARLETFLPPSPAPEVGAPRETPEDVGQAASDTAAPAATDTAAAARPDTAPATPPDTAAATRPDTAAAARPDTAAAETR